MPRFDYKEMYPEWDESANYCGANRYVVGDVGDDFDAWNNVQVYYSLRDKVYVLDQPFATPDLNMLVQQMKIVVRKLEEKLEK